VRIKKTRKFHVSMGNFEWVEFGAEADISTDDFPKAKTLQDLDRIADQFMDQSLAADLEEARVNTDEGNSFIHLYQQETN
jgi:hypothetical protein